MSQAMGATVRVGGLEPAACGLDPILHCPISSHFYLRKEIGPGEEDENRNTSENGKVSNEAEIDAVSEGVDR